MSFSSNDLTFPFQICAWNFNEGGPGLPKRIGAREKEATLLSEANISSTYVWSPILDILVKISPILNFLVSLILILADISLILDF